MSDHQPSSVDRNGPLADAVSSLRSRLDATAASAGRRRFVTGLVLAALLAGVGAYLSSLYTTIKSFAEPEVLVELAAGALEPRINEEVNQVGARLVAEAPAVMDQAEKVLRDAPPQMVTWAREQLANQFDGQLAELEEKVYTLLAGMLQESLERARREGVDLNDDAQLDKLVDDSVPLIKEELKKAIDELYAEYQRAADGIGALVDRLTSGEPLDEAEQRQKEILVTGLAIIRKLEADPTRAPVQGVLRGDVPQP